MSLDPDKIRALLASVAGFTEGPWHGDDLGRVVTVRAATPVCDYTPRANRPIIAAAPDLHRELTEAVGEIEIRDRQQAGTQAMLDGIWRTLDAAGVRDDVDERYMQQVSEHCYEPAGEHRQADPEERVGFLAAEVVRLRAHNARMAAQINALADACGNHKTGTSVLLAIPGASWEGSAIILRRLAAGEVDDV